MSDHRPLAQSIEIEDSGNKFAKLGFMIFNFYNLLKFFDRINDGDIVVCDPGAKREMAVNDGRLTLLLDEIACLLYTSDAADE